MKTAVLKMHDSVSLIPPINFSPTIEAAGCYCECENKVLFLKRQLHKSQGNTWGVPGGKLEIAENARAAVIRELYEEVGLKIEDNLELKVIGKLYVRLAQTDFIFHMFYKHFPQFPSITLCLEEHQASKWVTIEEALLLPLIAGGVEALKYYQQYLQN